MKVVSRESMRVHLNVNGQVVLDDLGTPLLRAGCVASVQRQHKAVQYAQSNQPAIVGLREHVAPARQPGCFASRTEGGREGCTSYGSA